MIQNCSISIRGLGYSPVMIDMGTTSDDGGFMGRLEFLAGLICLGESHELAAVTRCEEMNLEFPIVTLRGKVSQSPNVRAVSNNSRQILAEALSHLKGLGHKRIAYLGHEGSDARSAGFRDACAELDLDGKIFKVEVEERNDSYAAGHRHAKIITCSSGISATVCEDDEFAIGLMSGLRDVGLSVPDDFSVIGFDDLPFAAFTEPKLTTIGVEFEKRAEKAAKLLVSVIESNEVQREMLPEVIKSKCQLIVRESTGRVKS